MGTSRCSLPSSPGRIRIVHLVASKPRALPCCLCPKSSEPAHLLPHPCQGCRAVPDLTPTPQPSPGSKFLASFHFPGEGSRAWLMLCSVSPSLHQHWEHWGCARFSPKMPTVGVQGELEVFGLWGGGEAMVGNVTGCALSWCQAFCGILVKEDFMVQWVWNRSPKAVGWSSESVILGADSPNSPDCSVSTWSVCRIYLWWPLWWKKLASYLISNTANRENNFQQLLLFPPLPPELSVVSFSYGWRRQALQGQGKWELITLWDWIVAQCWFFPIPVSGAWEYSRASRVLQY